MGFADKKYNFVFDGGGKKKTVVPTDTASGFDIEKLAEDYVNSTYDKFTQGDEYAALEKRYSQAGRKAADDTIGLAAARTGGLASSYAVSAGAQAYGGYMERLEDAARSLYDSQMAEKANKLGVAQGVYDQQREDQRYDRDDARDQILTLIQGGKLDDAGVLQADIPDELLAASGWDPLTVEAYKSYYSKTNQNPVDDQSLILDFDADEIVEQLEGGNVNPSTLATYRKRYGRSYADVMIQNETFKELSEDQLSALVDDLAKAGDDEGADALCNAWYDYLKVVAESVGLTEEQALAMMREDTEEDTE